MTSSIRNVRIVSTGIYIPPKVVTAEEMDERLGCEPGWVEKKTGVMKRHFAENITASQMAAHAIHEALRVAELTSSDIDAIVCTSGTMEQPLPYTAALIQEALGWQDTAIPCLDINTSCLSFVTGFDVMSYLVAAGRYNRVILVASEIASVGLDYENKESAALMGDGAAAVIIERTPDGESGRILASHLETHSEGAHLSEVPAGGTKVPGSSRGISPRQFSFQMDGLKVFKLASQKMGPFCQNLCAQAQLTLDDLDLVVPHQASMMSLRLIRGKLNIAKDKWMVTVQDYGNTIAASIPMGLHLAIQQGKLKRGDRVMLVGTSAGLSVGGMIFEY